MLFAACLRARSNVFLIGPMGSGKTAVGKHLARLHAGAVSRQRRGNRVAHRRRHLVHLLARGRGGISATRTRSHRRSDARDPDRARDRRRRHLCLEAIALSLHERGFVVYLRTSLEQQVERVRQGRTRPLLHDVDPLTKLTELMAVRAPLYESLADFTHRDRRAQGAHGRGCDIRRLQGVAGPRPDATYTWRCRPWNGLHTELTCSELK